MGSLNNLVFDPESHEGVARTVNDRLAAQRESIYAVFKAP
jgi:hypothetical protein